MADFIVNNKLHIDIKVAGTEVIAGEHDKHIGDKPLPAEILITPAHPGDHFGGKCTACVECDSNPPRPVSAENDKIQFTVCPDCSIITGGSCPPGNGNTTVTVTVQDDQTC